MSNQKSDDGRIVVPVNLFFYQGKLIMSTFSEQNIYLTYSYIVYLYLISFLISQSLMSRFSHCLLSLLPNTVKPADSVTSIKRSPVLTDQLFFVPKVTS